MIAYFEDLRIKMDSSQYKQPEKTFSEDIEELRVLKNTIETKYTKDFKKFFNDKAIIELIELHE